MLGLVQVGGKAAREGRVVFCLLSTDGLPIYVPLNNVCYMNGDK